MVFANVTAHNAKYCLLAMLEKWKSPFDTGKSFGVLLIDLSMAFDCIFHEVLFSKCHVYGFSIAGLSLIHNYLRNRWHRTEINISYIP